MRLSSDFEMLQTQLGVRLPDTTRLERALTHGSVNDKGPPFLKTNEGLAFLGDAVIELAIREHLYEEGRDTPLGDLSIKADEVVRNKTLAKRARTIPIGPYIDLGEGAQAHRDNDSILASALEAVLGAIFRDNGLAVASDCAWRVLSPALDS